MKSTKKITSIVLALSVDPSSTSMSKKNTNGDPIWGNKMGLEFEQHVDHLFYMSGKVGISITLIQKHIADITTLTSTRIAVADVDHDGYIAINDATLIQKYIAGLVDSF